MPQDTSRAPGVEKPGESPAVSPEEQSDLPGPPQKAAQEAEASPTGEDLENLRLADAVLIQQLVDKATNPAIAGFVDAQVVATVLPPNIKMDDQGRPMLTSRQRRTARRALERIEKSESEAASGGGASTETAVKSTSKDTTTTTAAPLACPPPSSPAAAVWADDIPRPSPSFGAGAAAPTLIPAPITSRKLMPLDAQILKDQRHRDMSGGTGGNAAAVTRVTPPAGERPVANNHPVANVQVHHGYGNNHSSAPAQQQRNNTNRGRTAVESSARWTPPNQQQVLTPQQQYRQQQQQSGRQQQHQQSFQQQQYVPPDHHLRHPSTSAALQQQQQQLQHMQQHAPGWGSLPISPSQLQPTSFAGIPLTPPGTTAVGFNSMTWNQQQQHAVAAVAQFKHLQQVAHAAMNIQMQTQQAAMQPQYNVSPMAAAHPYLQMVGGEYMTSPAYMHQHHQQLQQHHQQHPAVYATPGAAGGRAMPPTTSPDNNTNHNKNASFKPNASSPQAGSRSTAGFVPDRSQWGLDPSRQGSVRSPDSKAHPAMEGMTFSYDKVELQIGHLTGWSKTEEIFEPCHIIRFHPLDAGDRFLHHQLFVTIEEVNERTLSDYKDQCKDNVFDMLTSYSSLSMQKEEPIEVGGQPGFEIFYIQTVEEPSSKTAYTIHIRTVFTVAGGQAFCFQYVSFSNHEKYADFLSDMLQSVEIRLKTATAPPVLTPSSPSLPTSTNGDVHPDEEATATPEASASSSTSTDASTPIASTSPSAKSLADAVSLAAIMELPDREKLLSLPKEDLVALILGMKTA